MTVVAPVSIDFSLSANYNEKIWFGTMYRIDAAFAAFFQVEIFSNFKIGLASDFGTQKLRNYNHGTFEVLLAYNINVLKKNTLKVRKF